jgi:outer membrane protein TolC
VGPDFVPPTSPSSASWLTGHPSPAAAETSLPVPEPVDPAWWALFNDPELTTLVNRVAATNLDVRLATIRLAQSRAQRGVVASAEFPALNGNGSYTREKPSAQGIFGAFGGSSGTSASGAGGGTSANGTGAGTGASRVSASRRSTSINMASMRHGNWTFGAGCAARWNRPMPVSTPRPKHGATRC